MKIYHDIEIIKGEIDEIKYALIPEDDPTEEELKEIKKAEKELSEGKVRSWRDIEGELD